MKGKTGTEIQDELVFVYGSSATSYTQVIFWVGEFNRDKTPLEDEVRSGRLSDATNENMRNKVQDLVYSNKGFQMEEIALAFGISRGSILPNLT